VTAGAYPLSPLTSSRRLKAGLFSGGWRSTPYSRRRKGTCLNVLRIGLVCARRCRPYNDVPPLPSRIEWPRGGRGGGSRASTKKKSESLNPRTVVASHKRTRKTTDKSQDPFEEDPALHPAISTGLKEKTRTRSKSLTRRCWSSYPKQGSITGWALWEFRARAVKA